LALAQPGVTWIHVEKPTFDLVGVVLSSVKLTGILLLVAIVLGGILGVSLILYRRRRPPRPVLQPVSLQRDA